MALTYEEWKAKKAGLSADEYRAKQIEDAWKASGAQRPADPTSTAASVADTAPAPAYSIGGDKIAPYGIAGMVSGKPDKKGFDIGNPGDALVGALSGVLNAGAETVDGIGAILNDHRLASQEMTAFGKKLRADPKVDPFTKATTYLHDVIPKPTDWLAQALVDHGVMDAKDGDLFKNAKPWIAPRDNLTGNLSQGLAQFLAGFAAGGKFIKAGVGAKAVLASGFAKGAFADYFAFDGNEARLSNLLRQYAGLRDPVTAYLAADKDDPETTGRIKSVLEGGGLGAVTESVLAGLRAIKSARKVATGAATREEAIQAAHEAGEAARTDASRISQEEGGRQRQELIDEANRLADVRLQAARNAAQKAVGSAAEFPVHTWNAAGVKPPEVPQQVFDDFAKTAEAIEKDRSATLAKITGDDAEAAPASATEPPAPNLNRFEGLSENGHNTKSVGVEQGGKKLAVSEKGTLIDINGAPIEGEGLWVPKDDQQKKAAFNVLKQMDTLPDDAQKGLQTLLKNVVAGKKASIKRALDQSSLTAANVDANVIPDKPITPVTIATAGRDQVARIQDAAKKLPTLAETKAENARAAKLKGMLDEYDKLVQSEPEKASKLSVKIHATLDADARKAIANSQSPERGVGQTDDEAVDRALGGGAKSTTGIDEDLARAIMDRYAKSAGAEGAAVRERTAAWDLANPGVRAKDVNLDHIRADDDVKQLISVVSDLTEAQIRSVRGETKGFPKAGVRTDAQRKTVADAFAKDMGSDPETLTMRLAELTGSTEHLDSKLDAARMIHVTAADEAKKATKLYLADRSEANLKRAVVAMQTFASTHTALKGATSEVARGLRSLRDSIGFNKSIAGQLANLNDEALNRMLDPTGSSRTALEAFQKLSGAVSHASNRRGIARLFEPSRLRAVEDFYTASILSAPRTHVLNILSNAAVAVLSPVEKMLGGAATLDPKMMQRALDQWRGMLFTSRETASLAMQAFRENRTFLDNTFGADYQSHFGAQAWSVNERSAWGQTLNALGKVVGFVPRVLGAQDEFFKQLHYRSELYAGGLAEARASNVAPEEMKEWVRQYVANGFDGQGMSIRARVPQSQLNLASNAYDRALQAARRNTFTEPLDPLLGQGERFLRAIPLGRLIVPFYRTPVSILKWAARRSMLSGTFYRDALGHNGKEMQQQAIGQMALGSIIYASALHESIAGNITGAGPSDANVKRSMMEAGWRPYSIKVGDKYLPYSRMDPVGIMLGETADLYEMQQGTYDDRPDDAIEAALRISVNSAQMLRDRSFMQGVDSVFSAIENGTAEQETANAERFEQRLVGGFVPNIISSALQPDATLVPRDAGEALSARVGANLEVKRNFFGEPATRPEPLIASDWISPFQTMKQVEAGDPLAEIARLSIASKGGMAPTARRLDGVDLVAFHSPKTERNAYDRYQELMSTVKVQGKTFREAATQLVNSDRYKNHMTDGAEDDEFSARGSRMRAIVAMRQRYRNAAEKVLRKEIPELDKQIKAARAFAVRQRRVSAVGADASASTVPPGLEWMAQ